MSGRLEYTPETCFVPMPYKPSSMHCIQIHTSRLNTILEEVYGENAVLHMMSGKSLQRAFRGHLLINKCLNDMIISEVLEELSLVVEEAEQAYTSMVNGEITLEAIAKSKTLSSIADAVEKKKTKFALQSKTSKLWLNYQTMIQCAMSLIKADRTGSWQWHLQAVSDFRLLANFCGCRTFQLSQNSILLRPRNEPT